MKEEQVRDTKEQQDTEQQEDSRNLNKYLRAERAIELLAALYCLKGMTARQPSSQKPKNWSKMLVLGPKKPFTN